MRLVPFLAALCLAACAQSTFHAPDAGARDLAAPHDLRTPIDLSTPWVPTDLASPLSSPDLSTTQPDLAASFPTFNGFTSVFWIMMENHSYDSVIGSANAPYINNVLLPMGGLATNYMDSGKHPSLVNYLYLTSGDTQYDATLIGDVDPTTCIPLTGPCFPKDTDNLGNQLTVASVIWRAYAEDMNTPCNLSGSGNYAPRHVPFLYYTDIQKTTRCQQTQVDFAANFANDLGYGKTPFMYIAPNLLDDGHDPITDQATGLMQADTWLSNVIPMIMASAIYKAGGVIFIVWDEGDGFLQISPGDHVAWIALSPRIRSPGYQSAAAYSHANFLATLEDIFSLPRLGAAQGVPNMLEFFQ